METTANYPTIANKGRGRPTKYSQKLLRRTYEYLNNYSKLGHKIPTKAGLSLYLGVSKDAIHEWKSHKDKQAFGHAIQELESFQEQELVDKGLDSTFNSTITKLCLATNHGYSDKPQGVDTQVNFTINKFLDKEDMEAIEGEYSEVSRGTLALQDSEQNS